MSIRERIEEIIDLHNAYATVRYDDKNHHVTELIDMFRNWHAKSSTLFSRYISPIDPELIKFKGADSGNAYVLASVFNDIETPFQILLEKLKISPFCKLENLIEEGETIVKGIKYQEPPSGEFRTYAVYRLPNESVFQTWKNNCLRLIELHFKQSNALDDFREAVQKFDKSHNAPKHMQDMIGILKSLIEIPVLPTSESHEDMEKSVSPITLNLVQNQSLSQNQSVVIDIFLESIKDELTGKQVKELKQIAKEESNPEKAKGKILDKIKSFGMDVLSNIVTNVITNPNVWSGLV